MSRRTLLTSVAAISAFAQLSTLTAFGQTDHAYTVRPGDTLYKISEPKTTRLLQVARSFMGTPYVWGGTSPKPGFDCSGFVQYVYARIGVHLPRQSHEQATVGTAVRRNQLKPGDLLFFSHTDQYAKLYANHVTHVGIYIGHGSMIESSSAHHDIGVVIVHHVFADPFYRAHYYGARRVVR